MLGGQKLQGPETAAEVNFMLKEKGLEDQFPLFTAVHRYYRRLEELLIIILLVLNYSVEFAILFPCSDFFSIVEVLLVLGELFYYGEFLVKIRECFTSISMQD